MVFSTRLHHSTFPSAVCTRVPFYYKLPTLGIFRFFGDSHPGGRDVASQGGLDLRSPQVVTARHPLPVLTVLLAQLRPLAPPTAPFPPRPLSWPLPPTRGSWMWLEKHPPRCPPLLLHLPPSQTLTPLVRCTPPARPASPSQAPPSPTISLPPQCPTETCVASASSDSLSGPPSCCAGWALPPRLDALVSPLTPAVGSTFNIIFCCVSSYPKPYWPTTTQVYCLMAPVGLESRRGRFLVLSRAAVSWGGSTMKALVWPDQVLAGGASLSSTHVGPSNERLPEP